MPYRLAKGDRRLSRFGARDVFSLGVAYGLGRPFDPNGLKQDPPRPQGALDHIRRGETKEFSLDL